MSTPEDTGDYSDVTAEIEEVKEIAADLRSVLPTRIEAAVQRALDAHEGTGPDARVAELHALALDTAQRTRALAADVRADRVSRIEDLEVVVDLLAEGLGAVRGDVARLEARSVRIEKELERVTWALDRVGTQLERFADDVTPPPASSSALALEAEPAVRAGLGNRLVFSLRQRVRDLVSEEEQRHHRDRQDDRLEEVLVDRARGARQQEA